MAEQPTNGIAAPTRRGLWQWLLGSGLVASVASFLYPVIRFVNPPDVAEAAVHEATVGGAREFPANFGKIVKFGSRPLLVIRSGEGGWRAFSATCTHLDCTVQYDQQNHRIWCACHNGIYDLNGKVVSGPPPGPLEEFEVHIRGEEIVVSRRA